LLKLYKLNDPKDTLLIKDNVYSGVLNDNGKVSLTHVLASFGLVQLYNGVEVDLNQLELVDDRTPSLSFRTQPTSERGSRAAHDPYLIRKDVYNDDCVHCKKIFDYCGRLHNV